MAPLTESIKSISTTTLPSPPSCIEFSPRHNHLFVVGTYTLTSPPPPTPFAATSTTTNQTRTGSLLLFRLNEDFTTTLLQIYSPPTLPAILDLHFSPRDASLLGAATSSGTISLYRLVVGSTPSPSSLARTGGPSAPFLEEVRVIQAFPTSTLILALTWDPEASFDGVAVGLSSGGVTVVEARETGSEAEVDAEAIGKAHECEAWSVAWANLDTVFEGYVGKDQECRALYSGGDDCKVRLCAVVTEDDGVGAESIGLGGAVWEDTKTHGAGVTAILPLSQVEERAVVTGSYDEFVRILVPTMGKRWRLLAEKKLGGGVWQLELLDVQFGGIITDTKKILVLASCMHAGVRMLTISKSSEDDWTINVAARFEEHESMNYGSGTLLTVEETEDHGSKEVHVVVSTSFYDKRLCVWHFEWAPWLD